MRVCLDTNVVVRLFVPHGPFPTVLVSTAILLEYEEVVTREFGAGRWEKLERALASIALLN
jgi:hypothetical protein